MSDLELTPTPAPIDAPATPTDPSSEGTPQAPSPVSLADDALLEFKVGGEVVRKPWSEVRQTQAMFPADYTRKTQEVAAARREAEARWTEATRLQEQLQQREARIREALNNPDELGALYLAAQARRAGQAQGLPQPQQPQAQPGLTPEGVQGMIQQAFQQIQQAQAQKTLEQDFTAFGQSLMQGTKLARIPGIDNTVWERVYAMGPSSPQEAKEMAKVVVGEFNRLLMEDQQQAVAQAAVQQAKAAQTILPSGGSAPMPTAKTYKGLDDAERMNDMVAYMEARLRDSA